MTNDDIIRMAQEAGAAYSEGLIYFEQSDLQRFAALVRADERDRATRENAYVLAERESCAELCDGLDDGLVDGLAGWQYAAAIRARGELK